MGYYSPLFGEVIHNSKQEKPVPGEWQFDENGKKYRMVGHCKEYAPMITTANGGTIYMDDLEAHNKRMKEQEEERLKELQEKLRKEPQRHCPFKVTRNSFVTNCKRECAFFDNEGCFFAEAEATKETIGGLCPITTRACRETCGLYNNGCALTGILKGLTPGKE